MIQYCFPPLTQQYNTVLYDIETKYIYIHFYDTTDGTKQWLTGLAEWFPKPYVDIRAYWISLAELEYESSHEKWMDKGEVVGIVTAGTAAATQAL